MQLELEIANAQSAPTAPTIPETKPGSDLVINPTNEQGQKGWDESLKWKKEQFDQLCALMKAAK